MFLQSSIATTLVQAFVVSKLDNLNSLLYGVPNKLIRKLQLVQNLAAHIIVCLKRYEHVTPALQELHWLAIHYFLKMMCVPSPSLRIVNKEINILIIGNTSHYEIIFFFTSKLSVHNLVFLFFLICKLWLSIFKPLSRIENSYLN